MGKINPRKSAKFDKHPFLKGKQSRLPDELQGKIIGSKLNKKAAFTRSAPTISAPEAFSRTLEKVSSLRKRYKVKVEEIDRHMARNYGVGPSASRMALWQASKHITNAAEKHSRR